MKEKWKLMWKFYMNITIISALRKISYPQTSLLYMNKCIPPIKTTEYFFTTSCLTQHLLLILNLPFCLCNLGEPPPLPTSTWISNVFVPKSKNVAISFCDQKDKFSVTKKGFDFDYQSVHVTSCFLVLIVNAVTVKQ